MVHTAAKVGYDQPSAVHLRVTQPGPFPYRVLYLQSANVSPGLQLRWQTPGTKGTAYAVVPASVLFTDALLERSELLTGSITGAWGLPQP
jgi:hypothetical protein